MTEREETISELARQVLDSRWGRHAADQVVHIPQRLRSELAKLIRKPGWRRAMLQSAEVEP